MAQSKKHASREFFKRKNTTQHQTTLVQHKTSTTRHNTRQHEYNTTHHEITRVQHTTTRVQHDRNTSKTQHQVYFDLFVSSLHTRIAAYCIFIKKILWHRCFSCEFCKIFKNTFFAEHLCAIAPEAVFIF